jgi:hypothetical protein
MAERGIAAMSDAEEETLDFDLRGTPGGLFTRVTETIDPEIYRLAGRVRMWTALAFAALNVPYAFGVEALGLDPHFFWRYLAVDSALLLLEAALGRWLWVTAHGVGRLARLNWLCIGLESLMILLNLWAYGSVNSQILTISALYVLMYRLAFDARAGVYTLVVMLLGEWALVAMELIGWLPHQPMMLKAHEELPPGGQLAALGVVTVMLLASFYLAHWVKLRLLDRETTLRALRQALSRHFPGEVGPETGRLLSGVYAVGSRLGRGGMGEVYKATDTRTGNSVAIKMMHPHLSKHARALRRFLREAAILRDVANEHVVRLFSIEQDEGRLFSVLELLDGETLQQLLGRAGPLSKPDVARLADHVAAALDVAHARGIVHRDVNPANVFLCRAGEDQPFSAKLLDFGVSKLLDADTMLTVEGGLLGTPAFMSPEQAAGRQKSVDERTDIYSLGLVIHTALAGEQPFKGDLPHLLEAIRHDSPPKISLLRSDVSARVDAVLEKAVDHSPERRYRRAGELARALGAALSESPPVPTV